MQPDRLKRRELLSLLGGAWMWPLAARAQQPGRMRLIGWLDGFDDKTFTAALLEGLVERGWVDGRNLKIERRLGLGDPDRLRTLAAELVSLTPEVLVAGGAATAHALQRATQTIPIILTGGGDPVANGLVKDIARPDKNVTGFSSSEPTISGKWLELLKDVAPNVARVAVVFKPEVAPTAANYIAVIRSAARAISVKIVETPFHDAIELVRSIDAFATEPNGALLMLPPPGLPERTIILGLAVQHRMPAIYPSRILAAEGGLVSYNTDTADLHRRAASYVDRILRGGKVADLPVQFPTKYRLVVNLKTAKAIGLEVPPMLLARADEVIE